MYNTCYSCGTLTKFWILSSDFRKILKYQISLKSFLWEPHCSMRTEGQTDRHEKASNRFL